MPCLLYTLTTAAWFHRETGSDWDKDLAEDVKGECEEKYGQVDFIKVEKESQVRIIVPALTSRVLMSCRAKST